jgi:nucleoside phosphorylase
VTGPTSETIAAARLAVDFERDHPRGLYLLAVHASLPAAVNPDLLHHLRDNFLLDGPAADRLPVTPESEALMARLLLSPLFAQVDSDLYEMVPAVRAVLLDALSRVYGEQRLAEVAALLERYTVQADAWQDRPELQWAQRVSARVVSDPAAVDAWLAATGGAAASGLDERWSAAMRARLNRHQELAAAVPRESDLHGPLAAVHRAIVTVRSGSGLPPQYACRILSGGLLVTGPLPPDTSDKIRVTRHGSRRRFTVPARTMARGRHATALLPVGAQGPDEALMLGDPPTPGDTLFVVTTEPSRLPAVLGMADPPTFTVATGFLPYDPPRGCAVVDGSGRLVGLTLGTRTGPDDLLWGAFSIAEIVEMLVSEVRPDAIASAVMTAQDGLVCLRLARAALHLDLLRAADEYAELAAGAPGNDATFHVRVLVLRALVAKLAGEPHLRFVDKAEPLLDELPAGDESTRDLVGEIVKLVDGNPDVPTWLPPRLTVLVARFDAASSADMDLPVKERLVQATPAELTPGQLADLQTSGSPGARLLAASYGEMPDVSQLPWLAERVVAEDEHPDVAYQAALALLAAAAILPYVDLDEVSEAVRTAEASVLRPSRVAAVLDDAATAIVERRTLSTPRRDIGLPLVDDGYDAVRRIGTSLSGREVVLARSRHTGRRVIVRYGRLSNAPQLRAVADALGPEESRYTTGPRERAFDRDTDVEIHDYIAGGSLADLRRRRPGAWSTDDVRPVLAELLDAVEFVHSCGVVVRNISPTGILVRSEEPLELVLTNFDQAGMTGDTRFATGGLQPAWAAPESLAGAGSPAADWWSVGIVLFTLLTGRNPFLGPDRELEDSGIQRYLAVHEIDVSPVRDRRWQALLMGLLTRDPALRWGASQLRAWLSGELPPIAAPHDPGFLFTGKVHTDPRMLADSFRRDRVGARALLDGYGPSFLALVDWAAALHLPATMRALGGRPPDEQLLSDVIAALGSDAEPPSGPVDVLVVAPLPTELDAAMNTALRGFGDHPGVAGWAHLGIGPGQCLRGRYLLADGSGFTVALAQLDHDGTGPVAELAGLLTPECVAVVGVCAGNPDQVALGDVIIADSLLADGVREPVSALWLDSARSLSPADLPSHGEPRVGDDPDRRWYSVVVGPMVSGDVVSIGLLEWDHLRAGGRRPVVGVDAEAAGIVAAGRSVAEAWLVVKGVADHGDPTQGRRHLGFAATAAADVLWKLLAQRLARPPGQPHIRLIAPLVDALVAVPVLDRDELLRALPPQIGQATPRHPAPRIDLISVVRTCMGVPGGLQMLADAVSTVGGDGPAVQRVRTMIASMLTN